MDAQGSSCAEGSQPLGADSCLASNVLKIQLLAGTLACHACSMETCKHDYQQQSGPFSLGEVLLPTLLCLALGSSSRVQFPFHPSGASSPILCVTGESRAGPVLAHTSSGVIQDVVGASNGYNLTQLDCLSDKESWDSAVLWFFGGSLPIWHPDEGPVFSELSQHSTTAGLPWGGYCSAPCIDVWNIIRSDLAFAYSSKRQFRGQNQ